MKINKPDWNKSKYKTYLTREEFDAWYDKECKEVLEVLEKIEELEVKGNTYE